MFASDRSCRRKLITVELVLRGLIRNKICWIPGAQYFFQSYMFSLHL